MGPKLCRSFDKTSTKLRQSFDKVSTKLCRSFVETLSEFWGPYGPHGPIGPLWAHKGPYGPIRARFCLKIIVLIKIIKLLVKI